MSSEGKEEECPFVSFLATVSSEERVQLLSSPPFTLFLFRLLNQSTQATILSLICSSSIPTDNKKEESAIIDTLESLDIVEKQNGQAVIRECFRRAYLKAILMGAYKCARLTVHEGEKKRKKEKEVTKKSAERWEYVLRYLALPSDTNTSNVSSTTRDVFFSANFTTHSNRDMDITSSGFQFLLLSPVKQTWAYMIELFKLEMKEGRSVMELIDVIVRMVLCLDSDPEKRLLELDPTWTERQMNFVMHLRELGLIFMRKRKDGVFYLTPLLSNLSVANDDGEAMKKGGNIIVETNFRVYAYTSSSLHLAILSSFTAMTYRFHDMCVGVLTRDSVRQALQVGITADQIISFLRANAHPQAVASKTPIPITVCDQIRLWEEERKRLLFTDAALYCGFESEKEFVDVSSFAKEENILLFSDSQRKCVVVTSEGHDKVKGWWKRRSEREGARVS